MTDAQRRYADARRKVCEEIINPVVELLDTAQAAMAEAIKRAYRAETQLEVLREAHEAAALSTLWGMLKVDNQTEAVARLEQLLLTEHRVSIERNTGDVL